MKPIVAIVGRPNVGKSTLFNRLLGQRKAVTSFVAGTTRDRLYGEAAWQGKKFILADTGGLGYVSEEELVLNVQRQATSAVEEADLILFLVDGKEGLQVEDEKIAHFLHKLGKKTLLCVNKIDSQKEEEKIQDFYRLGLGEPLSISALSGRKTGDLLSEIIKRLPPMKEEEKKILKEGIKVAIIGRPNVGKSSLLNKLIGQERMIVSEAPGTTRDAIDVNFKFEDKFITFIDTGGIRRRGKIRWGAEKFSVLRALRSIERTDIILLLIDAQEGPVRQDLHISNFALENYKGIILVVNKWDLIEKSKIKNQKSKIEEYLNYLRSKISFLPWAPVIFTSALTGKNVPKIFDLILEIQKEREKRIPSKKLNKVVSRAILENPPRRGGKIYYSTQFGVNPPTFVLMVNKAEFFHFSYLRYLENKIRENFGFFGTAVKIILKGKKNDKNSKIY